MFGYFGSHGSEQGDNEGFVFVIDYFNNRVQKFTTKGYFILLFNTEFKPSSITVDKNDLVYVNYSFLLSSEVLHYISVYNK